MIGDRFLTKKEFDLFVKNLNLRLSGLSIIEVTPEDPAFILGEFTALYDTDASNMLQLKWNENDVADRILNLLVNAADRTINLGGNLVLDGNNQVAAWTIAGYPFVAKDTGNFSIGDDISALTTGDYNLGYGREAIRDITSGSFNVGVGYHALVRVNQGNYNVGIGYRTLFLTTTGNYNVAIGAEALYLHTGSYNVAVGYRALYNATGNYNVCVGYTSGFAITTGINNTAVGHNALSTNQAGRANTAVGSGALAAMNGANAEFNTGIGSGCLGRLTSGAANTGVGESCLANATTADGCVAVGMDALGSNVSGVENTSVGVCSLFTCLGRNNTAIGLNAGYSLGNVNGGVYIGSYAGYYETAANKLFIDNAARVDEADGRTKALVYGVFDADVANQSLAFNAEVFNVSNYGAMQTATGDGTTTIDWGLGNFMYFTFGAQNDTFTFTAPANKGRMTLVLKQDGVGSRTATWPGTVLWPGGVAPTLSTGAADVDIITFFYDGMSYHGLFNGDFR